MSDEPEAVPEAAPAARSELEQGPFKPYVSKETGPGTGPDWSGSYAKESLRRVRASASVEEAGVQATVEAVILLHSIRRMLLWALVVVPLLAVGLWITMVAIASGSESSSCTSAYSCR